MAAKTPDVRLEDQWRDILSVHARTMCEIDRALHPYGLGASDFEVLDILASGTAVQPGALCRVQNIADRVHLSQSALSRLIEPAGEGRPGGAHRLRRGSARGMGRAHRQGT